MDIDLSKVIGYSRDSLQSRALMRSIMLDLYPGKTREMNVLLDVYESGVPRKIKNDGNITDAKYAQYIQKIVDDYGMQEQWAVVGLNAWIDVCLGKGTAATIRYNVSSVPTTGVNVSGGNSSGGGYTNPIVHNNPGSVNNAPVFKGKKDNYELKTITATTVEISKFVGFDESKTIIPNEIEGKKVVGIGPEAFQKCVGIAELIISEGIEYIEKSAFSSCSNLARVQFPTSLKKIGARAFSSTKIETVDLPNGISKLEDGAFSYCSSLRSVVFPDNLIEIGGSVFSSCKMLRNVTFPPSVRIIGYGAFSECTSLSQVKLNEGLKEIGGNAFKKCKSLTAMTMPSTVEKFGSKIFEGDYSFQSINITIRCYQGSKAIEYLRNNNINIEALSVGNGGSGQVKNITLPNPITHKPIDAQKPNVSVGGKDDYELKTITATTVEISKFVGFDESKTIVPNEINGKRVVGIGPEAFQKCVGITELIISEGIEYIEKSAFSGCSNLAKVQFPTTLKKIGARAFSSTRIENVDLPNGISKLEDGVFSYCGSLMSVVFPDNLTEIGGSAFSSCKMLRNVTLPPSVRIIGYGAFSECTSLSQVKLNEGLKEIGGNAFKKCKGLTSMVVPSSVETFGSKIFEGDYSFQSINIVLYCYPKSRAIEYARNNNIKIENARS